MSEAMDAKPTVEAEPLLAGIVRFWKSSVGAKVAMALTGIVLWGFMMAHVGGNLLIFFGPDVFNHYSHALKANAPLLWVVRIGLIVSFPVHIFTAGRAASLSRAARPVAYATEPATPIRPAAKWALWSGLGLLFFLFYHLAHFTWHSFTPAPLLADGEVDVYTMVVQGFQVPWISLIYILAQLMLAGHLGHGIYSLFQHLGIWGPSWTPFAKKLGDALGYGICGALITIPIMVLAGVVHV